jgi:tetratricopeptide (TPR) repeat protein
MGDYDKAYILAREAYEIKPYNNMAFTIMTQSKIAKEWLDYIKEADEYFDTISKIIDKENITSSDKIRIKLMLEILIHRYPYLKDSYLIEKELLENTRNRYLKAKDIYEKVFTTRNQ